jgi:hypothetical protein
LAPNSKTFWLFAKLKTFLAGKGCEVVRALVLSAKIIEGWSHRDRTRASTLFSTFEHVKSLLIMGPAVLNSVIFS